ncbi:MAG: ATP-binding cassette domain-containing protein [Gammaproteobacteria bacterium]|nr:ATP-binding cassette domain-containing protein [Gammaproteobacteria bacterium]
MSTAALLEVRDLAKHFALRRGLLGRPSGWIKAVDGVSFHVREGETLALVGESGCGKTTTGRAVLRLIEPSSGSVTFDGQELLKLNAGDLQRMRRDIQIVFQDPYSSLNPRMTVGNIVGEALRVHGIARGAELNERVAHILERVGLSPDFRHRYAHEFSGGQRQRVGIARALAMAPRFIVCDEAVSALDVSIQAQVINLLKDLQDEYRLAYLFITHDLNVVRHIAQRVAVMYLGRIVETAGTDELFDNPRHPYTRALLAANPLPDPSSPRPRALRGDVPSPLTPPPGCAFHPRCAEALAHCDRQTPTWIQIARRHGVACHLHQNTSRQGDDEIPDG